MNNLCIDIGNSRVKYLVYIDGKSLDIIRSKKLKKSIVQYLVNSYNVDAISVSTVRKTVPSQKFDWGIDKNKNVLILDYKTNIPIKNKYKTPKTLGNDRLAAVIGANSLYRDKNVLVIDFGTCIKYDFINAKNQFVGGNIAPGLQMRIQSMHTFTSQLPIVAARYNKGLLGDSTETALQNGAVKGTLYEVESFILRMKNKYGKLKVIFTGGDADFFANYTNIKIFVHQNLVLQGLNKIIQHNE